jgi:phospholipid/cholesterol/gamma-HCH transport system ATP-binding protein
MNQETAMTTKTTAKPKLVININGLETKFGSHVVHDNLDWQVNAGEIIGLVGGSGSGKTTLLRTIIMLQQFTVGSVELLGQELQGISEDAAHDLRTRYGMMFQGGALFGELTLLENVALPLVERTDLSRGHIDELAKLKIRLVGLPTVSYHKFPSELSGGMLKRAAVARALAMDPEVLFLDEPTAGLDPVGAAELDNLILELKAALGMSVVIITHDLDTLSRTTDRVAYLGEKKVLAYDSMHNLKSHSHPEIQAYFHGPRAARFANE